jgi:hypothetical protein
LWMSRNCFSASALRAEMCADSALLKASTFTGLDRVRKKRPKEREENRCCKDPENRDPKRNDDFTPVHVHCPEAASRLAGF